MFTFSRSQPPMQDTWGGLVSRGPCRFFKESSSLQPAESFFCQQGKDAISLKVLYFLYIKYIPGSSDRYVKCLPFGRVFVVNFSTHFTHTKGRSRYTKRALLLGAAGYSLSRHLPLQILTVLVTEAEGLLWMIKKMLPSLKLTAFLHLKIGRNPIGK